MVVCRQMTVSPAEHAIVERETPLRDFQPPPAAEPLNGQPLNPKDAYAGRRIANERPFFDETTKYTKNTKRLKG